jgi:hypothetical protein
MKYPSEVKKYLDVLDKYTEDNDINEFSILHMYPQELAYPNGYYDSRFFELVGYNTEMMKFRRLGRHDGLSLDGDTPKIEIIRIFADGSTLIRFKKNIAVGMSQAAYIYSK